MERNLEINVLFFCELLTLTLHLFLHLSLQVEKKCPQIWTLWLLDDVINCCWSSTLAHSWQRSEINVIFYALEHIHV